jgi:hypothetical protein
MTSRQIAAGLLVILLASLLGWALIRGAADLKLQLLLVLGMILGTLYTVYGQLPDWLLQISGGRITADDDPGNLSPRVYLTVLLVVLLLAAAIFVGALLLM